MGLLNDFFDIFNPDLDELSSTKRERANRIIRTANQEREQLQQTLRDTSASFNNTISGFERYKEGLKNDVILHWKNRLSITELSIKKNYYNLNLKSGFSNCEVYSKEYESTPFTFFFEFSERASSAIEYLEDAKDYRLNVSKERELVNLKKEMLQRTELHINLIRKYCGILSKWCNTLGNQLMTYDSSDRDSYSYLSKRTSIILILKKLDELLNVPVLDKDGNPSRESKIILDSLKGNNFEQLL